MRTLDLTPLYRTAIGFDRISRLLDTAQNEANSYPPYNIVKLSEDAYRIEMAVAGFQEDDIDVQSQDNKLVITAQQKAETEAVEYLHRGIAARSFERRFELADHIRVEDARLVNGLLHIDLVREVPESLKPRKIPVQRGATQLRPSIEAKAA